MFPEIVRDEVFRLETRRLWLRWPMLGDAFDAAAAKTGHVRDDVTGHDVRLPALACIAAWRAANEGGTALHLVLEDKDSRTMVGVVHLGTATREQPTLDYHLVPARRGEGLMTEAVQALVHMTFLLNAAPTITASPAADDRMGRAVLERCGFTYVGSGMRTAPGGRGLAACDHFRLDRRTWASLRGWSAPGLSAMPWPALPQAARIPAEV